MLLVRDSWGSQPVTDRQTDMRTTRVLHCRRTGYTLCLFANLLVTVADARKRMVVLLGDFAKGEFQMVRWKVQMSYGTFLYFFVFIANFYFYSTQDGERLILCVFLKNICQEWIFPAIGFECGQWNCKFCELMYSGTTSEVSS